MKRRIILTIALSATVAALSGPAAAQRPLAMLETLESGRWELRERGSGAAPEQVCLGDPQRLIQLRHPGVACERMTITDTPGEVTVQYTCRGQGYGRTHIRRESGRLIQLDSQGIAHGLPFSFAAEGRRVGACTA